MFRDLESTVQKDVVEFAVQHGWQAHKIDTTSNRGEPDYIFTRVDDGRHYVFYIEFKRPDKEPSLLQLKRHSQLQRAGFRVYVVDNVVDGRKAVLANEIAE